MESLNQVAQEWEQRSLKNALCYHWEMSAEEAISLLKESKERHCYLLRHSAQKSTFKLTVKGTRFKGRKDVFEHYTLIIKQNHNGNTYHIKNKVMTFDHLSELLVYYESNPIGYLMKSIGVPLNCDPSSPLLSASTLTQPTLSTPTLESETEVCPYMQSYILIYPFCKHIIGWSWPFEEQRTWANHGSSG
jgi:hypothetical protein